METAALRNGYTTGSCAAAAARAAALFLCTGVLPGQVSIRLPEGQTPVWRVFPGDGGLKDFCKVRKDAGDDPDITNGSWVYASVTPLSPADWQEKKETGHGYILEDYPGLYLEGGPGIGIAARPGLSCPVGHYAINPVPRRMILGEVDAVLRHAGRRGEFLVRIAIPAGEALAEKTFNPRLGIMGGISVLGTTGIVRPMSEDALLDTIRLDIRQKHLLHPELIVMTPGNYGEQFLADRLGIRLGEAVVCSNYAAAAMEALHAEGVDRLLFVGHIGKLIKIAAGMPNTHSKYGDRRMETITRLLTGLPGGQERFGTLAEAVRAANTTEEAIGLLQPYSAVNGGRSLAEELLDAAAAEARSWLVCWSGGRMEVEVITFSREHGIFGLTEKAAGFAAIAAR